MEYEATIKVQVSQDPPHRVSAPVRKDLEIRLLAQGIRLLDVVNGPGTLDRMPRKVVAPLLGSSSIARLTGNYEEAYGALQIAIDRISKVDLREEDYADEAAYKQALLEHRTRERKLVEVRWQLDQIRTELQRQLDCPPLLLP